MRPMKPCGCCCEEDKLGPVEKKVVELMRLHVPPYEILRVLAAAIDNANAENERMERLILTVKEDGKEVLIPKHISELAGYDVLIGDIHRINDVVADKVDNAAIAETVLNAGFATTVGVREDLRRIEGQIESINKTVEEGANDVNQQMQNIGAQINSIDLKLNSKVDADSLDATISSLGYTKENQVDAKIENAKPTKNDIVAALGYEPAQKELV